MIYPDSISIAAIMEMFYQMGYKETLTTILKFRKPNLRSLWNKLFTLLYKCFSERVTRSDCASKLFMSILYGLYNEINIDFRVVLWLKWYKAHIRPRDTARSLVLDFGQSLFRGQLISTTFLSYGTLSCVSSPLFIPQTLYLLMIPSFRLLDPFQRLCFALFQLLAKFLKLTVNSLSPNFVLSRRRCNPLLMKSINQRKEG